MQRERRALAFACGDDWLYGVLDVPAAPARRGVLFVVGGPQYRAGSHRQFVQLARSLAAEGVAAMRFDYRGMGDSEGAMRDFEHVGEDLNAAVDAFLDELPQLSEVVLWGLCDAALAASMYAAGDPRVAGLVLLNPWVRTEAGAAQATLKHYYRARLLDAALWKKILSGQFDFGGALRSFVRLLGSAKTTPALASAPDCGGALPDRLHGALERFGGKTLVLLSGADLTAQEFAGVASGSAKWKALMAAPGISCKTLPKADHTFSRAEWKEQVARWTIDWVRAW